MRTTERRASILLALLAGAGLLAGCESPATGTPSPEEMRAQAESLQAQADNLEAQAGNLSAQAEAIDAEVTRQAAATRAAQDAATRGTLDALAAQGTAQALAIVATREAWSLEATMTAEAAAARATQVAGEQNATATATAAAATATVQAALDQAQATAVQATAQHVARRNERERATQPLSTFGPWLILLAGIVAAGLVGSQVLPVLVARGRVVRRMAGESEPLVILERGRDGNQRIALPLRSFNHVFNAEQDPDLPPADLQDRATARQQLANVVEARAQGKSGRSKRVRRMPSLAPAAATPARGLPAPDIHVVEPNRVGRWIQDVEGQLIEEVND